MHAKPFPALPVASTLPSTTTRIIGAVGIPANLPPFLKPTFYAAATSMLFGQVLFRLLFSQATDTTTVGIFSGILPVAFSIPFMIGAILACSAIYGNTTALWSYREIWIKDAEQLRLEGNTGSPSEVVREFVTLV